MLHARLVIHRLAVDDASVDVRYATLVAALRAESKQVDWEVVADAVSEPDLLPGRYDLALTCIAGADDEGSIEFADLAGPAVLVRTVDRTMVFRGDGELAGLSPHLLS